MRHLTLSFAAVVLLAVGGHGQERAPVVQILSPEPGSLVNGVTTLRAGIEPADGVGSVTFFVDGRQVCEMTQPPFECEWDAGGDVKEHQVRLAVALTAGGRVTRTVRTKCGNGISGGCRRGGHLRRSRPPPTRPTRVVPR